MNPYLALFLVIAGIVLLALLALGVIGYAKLVVDRRERRRRGLERVRPDREQPVDLAREIHDFVSRRDSYEEARELGRVVA